MFYLHKLEKPDLDWQAERGSITSHQPTRYPNVQKIAPTPSAESSLHQGMTAETLARGYRSDPQRLPKGFFPHGVLAIPMQAFDAMNRSGCKW